MEKPLQSNSFARNSTFFRSILCPIPLLFLSPSFLVPPCPPVSLVSPLSLVPNSASKMGWGEIKKRLENLFFVINRQRDKIKSLQHYTYNLGSCISHILSFDAQVWEKFCHIYYILDILDILDTYPRHTRHTRHIY